MSEFSSRLGFDNFASSQHSLKHPLRSKGANRESKMDLAQGGESLFACARQLLAIMSWR